MKMPYNLATFVMMNVKGEWMVMRYMLRWWETLGRPERIVAMSLAVGGTVAITNSTVWAIAVCYMTRQKASVALAAAQNETAAAIRATATPGGNVVSGKATHSMPSDSGVVYAGS